MYTKLYIYIIRYIYIVIYIYILPIYGISSGQIPMLFEISQYLPVTVVFIIHKSN